MKYMVMFTRGEWEDTAPEAELQRTFAEIREWWASHVAQGKIVEGHQLQPPHTATTVVLDRGESKLIDGPFMEAKETIGGYAIVDVADLDEAIVIFRTFPSPAGKAEIRPVVQR
jgi:hypothetical protein